MLPSFVAGDGTPLIEIRDIFFADAADPGRLVLLYPAESFLEGPDVLLRDWQDGEVQRRGTPVTLDLVHGVAAADADTTLEQVELITIERFIRRLHMPAKYRLSAHGSPPGPQSLFSSVSGGRL